MAICPPVLSGLAKGVCWPLPEKLLYFQPFGCWLFDYPYCEDNLIKHNTKESGNWFPMDWTISQWNCSNTVTNKGLWKSNTWVFENGQTHSYNIDQSMVCFRSYTLCIHKCAVFLRWNITPNLTQPLLNFWWDFGSQPGWLIPKVTVSACLHSNWREGGRLTHLPASFGFPPL